MTYSFIMVNCKQFTVLLLVIISFMNSDSQSTYIHLSDLDNATLTQRVYRNLREDILANRLLPGTSLTEVKLATALGVSRGPVREALRLLGADGLVSLVPRRGAVVNSLTREEFLDSYRIREALEVLAIRLATPRLTRESIEELELLQEEMQRCAEGSDPQGFFEANMAFHSLIVRQSGNQKLEEIYFPLFTQIRRYRLSSMSLRGGLLRSCEEHREIINAIKNGSADEATRLLSEHIHVPQRILEVDDELELVSHPNSPDGKI